MKNRHQTFAEDLWLPPDEVGAEKATFIRKALHLRKGQRVLDAPCGAGRIAIHLVRAGCLATGVDQNRNFIRRVGARFQKEQLPGHFSTGDLREIEHTNQFHAAFSWLGSFGYFSESENIELLKKYAAALHPGGRLLIDQPNRERLLRNFKPVGSIRGNAVKNRWNAKSQRVESVWMTQCKGKVERNRMSIRLYTKSQMQKLFEKAGLQIEAIYGSIQAEPYRRSSRRMIFVGRKPPR